MLIDVFLLLYVPLGATDPNVFFVILFLLLTFSLFIFRTFSRIRQELGDFKFSVWLKELKLMC